MTAGASRSTFASSPSLPFGKTVLDTTELWLDLPTLRNLLCGRKLTRPLLSFPVPSGEDLRI
jgi:hypothetical protein